MRLMNSGGQQRQDYLYVADGSITTGGTAQLVLGSSISRSHLLFQNTSNGPLWIEIGSARATCTISNGVVNAVTVTNAGMGFTYPPVIEFLGGGGNDGPFANSSYTGLTQPNAASAHNPAQAVCVMTGSAPNKTVASITIANGGGRYLIAPYVFIQNSPLDPNGGAAPALGSGILVASQTPPLIWNGSVCPTETVTVFGSTTGQTFICRWMD